MTATKGLLPQKRSQQQLEEETSSSSITEDDRNIYLLVSQEKSEFERLAKQAETVIQVKGGYFHAPVRDLLEKGITVLDSGCGTGTWALEMSKQYPQSTFYGVDISPTFETGPEAANKPSNCRFILHNLLKPMPFPDNNFSFIHQQFLVAAIPEKSWPLLINELSRILKPGGWIELTEVVASDVVNMGPKFSVLSKSIRDGGLEKGIRYSVGRELEGHLINSGAINIDMKPMLFPIGHGGPIGEFWSDNITQLLRQQLQWMVMKRNPELKDPKAFEAYLSEATQECAEYKASYMVYRYYAQKPYDDPSTDTHK